MIPSTWEFAYPSYHVSLKLVQNFIVIVFRKIQHVVHATDWPQTLISSLLLRRLDHIPKFYWNSIKIALCSVTQKISYLHAYIFFVTWIRKEKFRYPHPKVIFLESRIRDMWSPLPKRQSRSHLKTSSRVTREYNYEQFYTSSWPLYTWRDPKLMTIGT